MRRNAAWALLLAAWAASAARAQSDFSGQWQTTYGPMILTQQGSYVSGSYQMSGSNCTVQGQVSGGQLSLRYQEPHAAGQALFDMSADGSSFSGRWKQDGQSKWNGWSGHRTVQAAGLAPTGNYSGIWNTTFGRMTLAEVGAQVQGGYEYGGGSSLSGTDYGGRFSFRYQERSAAGEGWFQLAPDGRSFSGQWRQDGQSNWGSWSGTLIAANPAAPPPPQAVQSAAAPAAPAAPALTKEDLRQMLKEVAKESAPRPVEKPAAAAPVSDVDRPNYHGAERPDDFAIVVGVEKYADLPEARFAERDAVAMRDHLLALGVPARQMTLLTGAKATRTGMVKNLETWLPRNVKEGSTVFFYFSGHGSPDVQSGEAYLMPSDADPQYLAETAYPLKRLYAKLGALKAKRVVVTLDSCFSGAGGRSVLAKGTRPLVTHVKTGDVAPGKVVSLSAAGPDQVSGSLEEQGHGTFTYYLLKGLNGAAAGGDGAVSVESLYEYLRPKVADAARLSNRDQIPSLRGTAQGITLRGTRSN